MKKTLRDSENTKETAKILSFAGSPKKSFLREIMIPIIAIPIASKNVKAKEVKEGIVMNLMD